MPRLGLSSGPAPGLSGSIARASRGAVWAVWAVWALSSVGACRPAREAPARPAPAPEVSAAALDYEVIGAGAGPLVVLLHGYGTPGDDLVPLARALGRDPRLRDLSFVAPVGRLATDWGGRAWWALPSRAEREAAARQGARDLAGEHPPELPASRDAVLALVDRLRARYSVPADRVAIGGFSQGAMLAVDVAVHEPDGVGAVFALSGSVVGESEWRPRLAGLDGVPALVSHGRADPVLPFAGGQRLEQVLDAAGADVTFVPFDGDHSIPPVVQRALADFLAQAFGR